MVMIVRVLADAFDTRTKSKDLYEASVASPVELDYRKSRKLLEQEMLKPLRDAGLRRVAEALKKLYDLFENDYLQKIVSKADIVGVDEKEYGVLLQYVFCLPAHELLRSSLEAFSGPDLFKLLAQADTSVGFMLEWLEREDSDWRGKNDALPRSHDKNHGHNGNTDRETILSWRNNESLPSLGRLHAMPFVEKYRTLILLARAVAWAARSDLGKQILEGIKQVHWGVNLGESFEEALSAIAARRRQTPSLQKIGSTLSKDISSLLLKENKGQSDKDDAAQLIGDLQKIIDDEGLGALAQGLLDFFAKARWHLFNGDPKKTIELIEKAFQWSAYRAGPFQEEVLISLLITAAGQNPPDKVSLKRAKNLLITFGYEIPSAPEDKNSGRSRSADLIEDWEINLWAREYQKHTPSGLFFPGAEPKSPASSAGLVVLPMTSESKPDYRYPNRRLKLKNGQGPQYPQLCYYILRGDFDSVKELLKRGASVNVKTSSGDTPLMLAVCRVADGQEEDFFDLIAAHAHEIEIVNARTEKKRKTALLLAIEAGKPKVVQKLLDMGADPNLRGETEWQTPLYRSLSLYGLAAQGPEGLKKAIYDNLDNPYTQDAIRRYTNGHLGAALSDQTAGIEKLLESERHREIFEATADAFFPASGANPESQLEIMRLLLAKGADSNAAHEGPHYADYTSLALACELDLADIVTDMLEKYGGNLDTTVTHKNQPARRTLSLYDIAAGHNASAVTAVIIDKRSASLKP